MPAPTPAKDAYLELAAKTPFGEKRLVLWFLKALVVTIIAVYILSLFNVFGLNPEDLIKIYGIIIIIVFPPLFVLMFLDLNYTKKVRIALLAYCKEYVENKLSCIATPLYQNNYGKVLFRMNSVVLLFDPDTENILLRDGSALTNDTLNFYQSLFVKLDQQ